MEPCGDAYKVSFINCNSLDSTLRTALASFYVSDTDWYSIGGILSVIAIFQR